MRELHYILDAAGEPVPEPDVLTWAKWFEEHTKERIVGYTKISDEVSVSTVFLALDHGYSGEPILYETMVFGGPLDETQDRYATRRAAEKGHQYYVNQARTKAAG